MRPCFRYSKIIALPALLILTLSTLSRAESIDAQLKTKIEKALSFSQIQLEKHAQRTGPNRFTCYTDRDGNWRSRDLNGWCCGFSAGLMWMMYEYTGDRKWADYGRDWNDSIRPRATASDQDTGFQIFNSFGYALRYGSSALTPAEIRDYESVLNWATHTFTTQRYNAHVGGFRTWPPTAFDPYKGKFEVNSDMIMNLELPLWVATTTGNMDLLDKVARHEGLIWRHIVFKPGDKEWEQPDSSEYVERNLGSHWHVVEFDPKTGVVVNKRTAQGDKTESTWSRGQSWLIYGYAMLYRYSGYPRYLERAEYVFDYYMKELKTQSQDSIPFSDFDAALDDNNPLDTSAAAVVASAAIELYQFTGKKKYISAAETMLRDLTSEPYLATNIPYEAILTRGSHSYDRPAEVGTIFGDFYFVEAMLRYLALNK